MKLTTAEIDRYGPLYDCRPECGDGITVLSGPNEAGKTLYIEALLQLLEPDIVDVMSPGPRVGQPPTGRVLVEHGGEEFECDGSSTISDIAGIEPSHLESVFVVRDSDLILPDDQAYYTSLIEKLGDIHTTEINAIKSALKDRGRLTDRRLNISSDRSHHNADSVRDDAASLAQEIRDYTERIEEDALDELASRRLRVKRELRQSREELELQRDAELIAEHERLTEQLQTYLETSEQLAELGGFDRDELEELRELRNGLDRNRRELDELETSIEEKNTEVDEIEATLRSHQDDLSKLEQRQPGVDEARSALQTYRDRRDNVAGAERQIALSRMAAIAGLLGAGAAGGLGAISGSTPAVGLGILLLLVALGSGFVYRRANNRLAAIETAKESVLQSARDAGFDVEAVENVAPAIESFDTELSQARDRRVRTEQRLEDAQDALAELRDEKSKLEDRITENSTTLEDRLATAGVESIEEYKERVERREELNPDQQAARQSLIDQFGDPDEDGPQAKVDAWERELEELIQDIDLESVDVETFDEGELDRLEEEVERLESELEELQNQLEEHDDRLDDIDREARGLNTQPFVGQDLALEARSKEGLESLANDLDSVVEAIEQDAELSRKALDVFEGIEEQEEEKLTDLFAHDGPASVTFERLTGGRYTQVAYDAEAHDLIVDRRDGRTFGPEVLSQGTKDQLYFATRVSLAQQLLGNEPGFFLLDDPFVAADAERLRQGFQTLQDLAAEGWQILYMTSKQEVRETMVDEFTLDRVDMEAVPLGTD